jgi:hypothetical protein
MSLRGSVLPVRTDRLSGRTEILSGMSGWIEVGDPKGIGNPGPKMQELPAVERAKVTGNAGIAYDTSFQGKLYNGSSSTCAR